MDNKLFYDTLNNLERNFQSVYLRLPPLVGNEAVNFTLDNFKRQGFLGDSFQPWARRKDPNKWGQHPPRNSRPVLMDTGALRRSIRMISHNGDTVVIGSDMPYAQAHNEGVRLGEIQSVKAFSRKLTKLGVVDKKELKTRSKIKFGRLHVGDVEVKPFTRRINQNIPKRQFMGDSPYLRASISRIVAAEILRALKQS